MPLEIRELVIRTIVSSDSALNREDRGEGNGSLSEVDQAVIIATCIDQVLSILQARAER
ncbi:hypothetical protein H6F90_10720 [Trichocoleus sp. FACHB-591]|uniref:DUF5908 family protein n=1 Tax=Trichocoleus sp. FACHB-591 TaxID=2692872 RepID=UPI001686A7EB|nr:DUF5908 family protein [Trichocoleus sp. FACHB-591]MBD2095627.1 hypothetical protein [Trichocoleus sp. FACHB-591]